MSLHKTSILFSFIAFLFFPYVHAGFIAGTLVKTVDGFIPIEKLAVGDKVFAFDEQADAFLLHTITDINFHKVTHLIHINVHCSASDADIITDADQPFYLPADREWCCAQDLKLGMVLQSYYEQRIVVKNVEEVDTNAVVYDLTLNDPHTFCVTSDGIVAHNLVIVVPLTLGLVSALKVVGTGLATYLLYEFVVQTTKATIDYDLNISNSNLFGSIDSRNNVPGHGKSDALGMGQADSGRHLDGQLYRTSVMQPTNSPTPYCGNSNLPKSPAVHDTRSFPVPKVEPDSGIGCGTGLLTPSQEQDKNRPSCDQGAGKGEERGCGTGLLSTPQTLKNDRPSCVQSGNKGNSEWGPCIVSTPEDVHGEYESSAGNFIYPEKDQGMVYTKNGSRPKTPDSNGAQAPGMPRPENDYFPPKNWNGEKVRSPRGYGWPDKGGNIWVPTGPKGHGGPHWDVQNPKGKYQNVFPDDKLTDNWK